VSSAAINDPIAVNATTHLVAALVLIRLEIALMVASLRGSMSANTVAAFPIQIP
jgi:hypothetical protein